MAVKESENHVFQTTETELQRLEFQGSKLYGGMSFLEPFLVRNPRKVLDVGCGSGFFTRQVARALPHADVAGLDIDESRITHARSHSSENGTRFELGDMANMPFSSDSFDLVFCRFALVHNRNPSGAFREMARVARSGGFVVAYDMIHDGIWFAPYRPAFTAALRKVVEVLRKREAEPNQGLLLASWMHQAGLGEISFRVIAHHVFATDELYESHRDNWVATLRHLGADPGPTLDEETVEAAVAEIESASGNDLLSETTVLASGKKP